MADAMFTTSESSAYDDQPELRYHFPKTYLNQVEQAIGDLIVYYEPRRPKKSGSRRGDGVISVWASLKRENS